jgi:hypothetical protein
MAIDLKASVRNEIGRLKKQVIRESGRLDSLKDQLKRVEEVYALLGSDGTEKRRRRARTSGRRLVNWSSVLASLPSRFTLNDLAKARSVKGKSKLYLRQVVARWAKEGKTKRIDRGKYQKV